jgi:hypothetical protein
MQKQKTTFVIRAVNKNLEDKPHFYSHTNNVKQRIKRIKETLAQDTVPYAHMAPFKGQQNELTYEVYKYAFTLQYDSKRDRFVKV